MYNIKMKCLTFCWLLLIAAHGYGATQISATSTLRNTKILCLFHLVEYK